MKKYYYIAVVTIIFVTSQAIIFKIVASMQNDLNPNCSLEQLQQEAPETLQPPRWEDFYNIPQWVTATRHYKLGGTWATLADGTVCHLERP